MADPVSVLKDFDGAWNAHDEEGVMSFFTDDAVVRVEPPARRIRRSLQR
jgi:ketosteroid isomerase-like protein